MRALWFLLAAPLAAHTVSISTGELVLDGVVARYRIWIPPYEVQHIREPERTVLDTVQLEGARLAERKCGPDGDSFRCEGKFVFPSEPERIEVTVRLHEAVVNNHVHMLHARKGDLIDQVMFDAGQQRAILQFRRAGAIESAIRTRPAMVLAVLLIALAIGIGARTHRELALIAGSFATGAAAAGWLPWGVTPSFAEAAVMVAAAYAAFEAVFLPNARQRWFPAGALGIAAGVYVRVLIAEPGARVSIGAMALLLAVLPALAVQRWKTARRVMPVGVLAGSLVWFVAIVI